MKALGRHILAEVYGCDPTVLNDVKHVEAAMVQAALVAGAEVREVAFHRFSPQGVSGVVIISESHLAIHTWPELGYAAVDVFTCGDDVDPWIACQHICAELKAASVSATETKRGILHPWGPLKGETEGARPEQVTVSGRAAVRPAPVGVTG